MGQYSTQKPHPLQRSAMIRTSPRGTDARAKGGGIRARFTGASGEAGTVLFASAEKIFSDVEEARARLRELKETGAGLR